MRRNKLLFFICVFANLVIGNIVVKVLLSDTPFSYHLLISILVSGILALTFVKLKRAERGKMRVFLLALTASLACMLVACIFTAIANRLPHDTMFTAGLKGILPMYVFAFVFASPIWVSLTLVNYFCLVNIKHEFSNPQHLNH